LKRLKEIKFEMLDFSMKNPTVPYREIAVKFGSSLAWIKDMHKAAGLHRPRGIGSPSNLRGQLAANVLKRERLLRELGETNAKISVLEQKLEQRASVPKEKEAAA
jgi:hypothetical protein